MKQIDSGTLKYNADIGAFETADPKGRVVVVAGSGVIIAVAVIVVVAINGSCVVEGAFEAADPNP